MAVITVKAAEQEEVADWLSKKLLLPPLARLRLLLLECQQTEVLVLEVRQVLSVVIAQQPEVIMVRTLATLLATQIQQVRIVILNQVSIVDMPKVE